MLRAFRSLVRTSAFLGKEITEIMRQPRLILTLLLGPFLILLLFGIGYRNQARSLRLLFVADPQGPVAAQIREYASSLGPQLIFAGIIADAAEAEERLRRGEADAVVLTPDDIYGLLRDNQRITFTLLHDEIDPLRVDYVRAFGQVYVDEINRRVLQSATASGQSNATTFGEDIAAARATVAAIREALRQDDLAQARADLARLDRMLGMVERAAGQTLGLLEGVQGVFGGQATLDTAAISANLAEARSIVDALAQIPERLESYSAQIEQLDRVDGNLAALQELLAEFRKISPAVMISPFRSDIRGIAAVQPTMPEYFAPAVIVLLLQHLAVTFAGLSIVRERRSGVMELFRVSPLSALETMIGKYLSYLAFGGVLAAGLTALVILALRVPMLGDWPTYALALAAVLFTSLGLGFLISLISQTDSPAVQLTMLVLLSSVFFSGFIMSLDMLAPAVRAFSWLIPATYGIRLLQDAMLRGHLTQPFLLLGLIGMGAALFVGAWLLLRRQMAQA